MLIEDSTGGVVGEIRSHDNNGPGVSLRGSRGFHFESGSIQGNSPDVESIASSDISFGGVKIGEGKRPAPLPRARGSSGRDVPWKRKPKDSKD